jgi:hypothetical protein
MAVIRQRLQGPGVVWHSNGIKGILLDEELPKNSLIRIDNEDREIILREQVKVKYYPSNGQLSFTCGFVNVRSTHDMKAVLQKLGFDNVREFMKVYFHNIQAGGTFLTREYWYYSFNGVGFVC